MLSCHLSNWPEIHVKLRPVSCRYGEPCANIIFSHIPLYYPQLRVSKLCSNYRNAISIQIKTYYFSIAIQLPCIIDKHLLFHTKCIVVLTMYFLQKPINSRKTPTGCGDTTCINTALQANSLVQEI